MDGGHHCPVLARVRVVGGEREDHLVALGAGNGLAVLRGQSPQGGAAGVPGSQSHPLQELLGALVTHRVHQVMGQHLAVEGSRVEVDR